MEFLLNWIKGIMGCLLVMSLILQCIPGKIYRPYLRLFMGIILILTILSPLTESFGLGEALETLVGQLAYEEKVPGWEEKLLKGEDWARGQILSKAEENGQELPVSAESVLETWSEQEKLAANDTGEGEESDSEEAAPVISIDIEIGEIPTVNISGGE